MVQKITAHW